MVVKKTSNILSFFKPRVSVPRVQVPRPRLLENGKSQSSGDSSSPSKLDPRKPSDKKAGKSREALTEAPQSIQNLRRLTTLLPNTIPEGTAEDHLAQFSVVPHFDPSSFDFWEDCGDRLTNRFFGIDVPLEMIKGMIRRGRYGIEGVCDWLEIVILQGGVEEALLEGKMRRISEALWDL